MNCDEVFRHLTRFESHSASNGRLEPHLASCSSCREIAELFRLERYLSHVDTIFERVFE